MFNDSYSNKVGSATLNNIQGNQHINYYLQHQHQSVPAYAGGEEWKRKMYREVRTLFEYSSVFVPLIAVVVSLCSGRKYQDHQNCCGGTCLARRIRECPRPSPVAREIRHIMGESRSTSGLSRRRDERVFTVFMCCVYWKRRTEGCYALHR